MRQNNFKVIGITGGIATGKSTVTNILEKEGYIVIDADKIARDVVKRGQPAYRKIVNFFGKDILNKDGDIDRKRLGDIIFRELELRKILNTIVHPYIYEGIKSQILKYGEMEKIIFLDIPLLIEERENFRKYGINFDEIWLVYLDKKTQLKRLMKRDSITKDEALDRINAQFSIELKKEHATRVLDNRGNLKALEKQLEEILKETILSMEG